MLRQLCLKSTAGRPTSLGHVLQRNTECLGHPLAVSRIGLQAVADVANFDLPERIGNGTGGIAKQKRLFFRTDEAEQQARLGVIVAIVFTEVPAVRRRRLCDNQARSKRSRFITLFHTATKSCRNFSWESLHP